MFSLLSVYGAPAIWPAFRVQVRGWKLCKRDSRGWGVTIPVCMTGLVRIALGVSRIATQLFVFFQRVVGLAGAADQLLLHAEHPNPLALVVAGCLLAGAQATESLVLAFLDRLIAHPSDAEHGGER